MWPDTLPTATIGTRVENFLMYNPKVVTKEIVLSLLYVKKRCIASV